MSTTQCLPLVSGERGERGGRKRGERGERGGREEREGGEGEGRGRGRGERAGGCLISTTQCPSLMSALSFRVLVSFPRSPTPRYRAT
eukprot:2380480-Rhodomonas_salina.1